MIFIHRSFNHFLSAVCLLSWCGFSHSGDWGKRSSRSVRAKSLNWRLTHLGQLQRAPAPYLTLKKQDDKRRRAVLAALVQQDSCFAHVFAIFTKPLFLLVKNTLLNNELLKSIYLRLYIQLYLSNYIWRWNKRKKVEYRISPNLHSNVKKWGFRPFLQRKDL